MVLYHATNPKFKDLTMECAKFLVLRKDVTTEEISILIRSLPRLNFNKVSRKVA